MVCSCYTQSAYGTPRFDRKTFVSRRICDEQKRKWKYALQRIHVQYDFFLQQNPIAIVEKKLYAKRKFTPAMTHMSHALSNGNQNTWSFFQSLCSSLNHYGSRLVSQPKEWRDTSFFFQFQPRTTTTGHKHTLDYFNAHHGLNSWRVVHVFLSTILSKKPTHRLTFQYLYGRWQSSCS